LLSNSCDQISEMDLVIATWALVGVTILVALFTLVATWEARRQAQKDRNAAERLAAQGRVEGQRQFYANWQRSETLRGLAQLVVAVGVVEDVVGGLLGSLGLLNRGIYDRSRYVDRLRQIKGIRGAAKDISNARATLDLVAESEFKDAVHSVEKRCKDLTLQFGLYRSEVIVAAMTDPLPSPHELEEARKAFREATKVLSQEWLKRNLEAVGPVYGPETDHPKA